jgi:hypothetical protein
MTNRIVVPKYQIDESLRVFGGENIWVRKIDLMDFYIETEEDNLNIWGSYNKSRQIDRQGEVGIIRIYFPRRCPKSWLTHEVQSSPFHILTEGASTPLGYQSRIDQYETLEKALDEIQEERPKLVGPGRYGDHTLFLGRKVEDNFLFKLRKSRRTK